MRRTKLIQGKLIKMIDIVECNNPATFNAVLADCEVKCSTDNKPLFILFTGTKGSNGRSWCGDCTAADPIIFSALRSVADGCRLLTCDVVREDYRNPDYSYRKHPKINLKCVPTLIKWSNSKAIARLNDSQSQNADLVQELIEA